MSPSSAFSHRRQILRRPKICLPPPPPPPPPPPDWPPDSFSLFFEYIYFGWFGPVYVSWTITMDRVLPLLQWSGSGPGPEFPNGFLTLNCPDPAADLTVGGINLDMGGYNFPLDPWTAVCGTPTLYELSAPWNRPPWMTAELARFTL